MELNALGWLNLGETRKIARPYLNCASLYLVSELILESPNSKPSFQLTGWMHGLSPESYEFSTFSGYESEIQHINFNSPADLIEKLHKLTNANKIIEEVKKILKEL